jgi:hypothetical protein
MNGLVGYLTENCCTQGGSECATACNPAANRVRNKSRRVA